MIVLDTIEDRFHFLQTPGSYEWTYVDGLSDDREHGFVAIWFRGCPMSPYYTGAIDRMRGAGPSADDHCAFVFSIYRRGRRIYSTFREGPAEEFAAEGADVRYGRNSLRSGLSSTGHRSYLLHVDERRLLGRGGVVGDVEISAGPLDLGDLGRPYAEMPATHYWVPAMPHGRFTARLDLLGFGREADKLRFSGHAYHDRNFGTEPLHHIAADWHWGRLHSGSRTFVYFGLVPDRAADAPNAAADALHDGRPFGRLLYIDGGSLIASADAWAPTRLQRRRHWATLPSTPLLEGASADGSMRFRAAMRHAVDSGPFYHRMIADIVFESDAGELRGTGITEFLRPARLGVAAFRPFIKFRTRRK